MPIPIPFGRYLLLDRLAAGGMGEIFLARMTGEAGFEKVCVVKRVLPHLAADPGFQKLFLDEARLAARLNHPGIAQLFDLGKVGDAFYIAMEYLPGEDGATIVHRCAADGRLMPLEVAVQIASAAADALHFAHQLPGEDGRPLEIVHRDVSPSNLLVTYRGAVKVLDFGVARASAATTEPLSSAVKGKLAYLAPEQLNGQATDRRADVWALATCLHEFLTGRRLFGTGAPSAVIAGVLVQPIRAPSASRADVPAELDAIVLAALERDVERRTPSAEAFARDLRGFLDRLPLRVGQNVLGDFLLERFGAQRAGERERLALTAGAAPADDRPRTEVLPAPERHRPNETEAARAPTELLPSRAFGPRAAAHRPGRGPWLAGLVLLAAAIGAAAVLARPGPQLPGTAVEAAEPAGAEVRTAPEEPKTASQVEPREPPVAALGADAPGAVDLETVPPVNVWLGDRLMGRSPLRRAELPPGTHQLRLENRALGILSVLSVKVAPGATASRRVTFRKGELHVAVDPWADVYVDGVKRGQTPIVLSLYEGEHLVRLHNPWGEKRRWVKISPGQVAALRDKVP